MSLKNTELDEKQLNNLIKYFHILCFIFDNNVTINNHLTGL